MVEISAADILTFALEVVAITAVTMWGWHAHGWLGGVATPVAFAAVWGTLLSPKALLPTTGLLWPSAKFAVFTVSALALNSVAGLLPATAFLALSLLGVILGGAR